MKNIITIFMAGLLVCKGQRVDTVANYIQDCLTNYNGTQSTNYMPIPSSMTNGVARSIVSIQATNNGFMVSSNHWAMVNYSLTVTATSTLTGGSVGTLVLELCPSNSVNATDWKMAASAGGGQSSALIVGLSLVNPNTAPITAFVPPSWYTRIRSVNATGLPAYAFVTGQEILY